MKKIISLLLTAVFVLSLFSGCGKKVDSPLIGDWAYIHDPATTIISLKNNGKAKYNNKKYTFTNDETYISLTSDNSETVKFRYELTKDGFLMYQTTEYEYAGEGTPDSVIGSWINKSNKWSYEFTADGTFNEDGYFPGYYAVDESTSSIKLMYNDHFIDTTIYYHISGNTLTIDYPWTMVRAE